MEAKR
ncbi:hypothetical protein CISIN_1g0408152mg, partial [Citrus sinensis]